MSAIDLTNYGYPSAEDAKAKLLATMDDYGVGYLEAYYYGGNDEGGVQDVQNLKTKDGAEMTIADLDWQHPLQEAADNVLSSEFGSWAGEFSASGTLYADLKERKVWRSGSQTVEQDDGGRVY